VTPKEASHTRKYVAVARIIREGIAHATAAVAPGQPAASPHRRAHAQSAVMFGVWDILTTLLRVGHYV
jgi:hypothetical protein